MNYFCTYFDQNYLSRGLAMYDSLRKHCPAFKLWILCMDQRTYRTMEKLNLPNTHWICLEDFEKDDKPLLNAKQNRSKVEYYFTCTPSLPLFVLKRYPDIDLITYLDADLFFFANPSPLLDEMNGKSIGIISHRFPTRLQHLEMHGIYNVGWLSFRHDQTGLDCLQFWRELCLEWCYDRVESNRYADQKYLDQFPKRYGHEIILQHRGANVAPWNIENYPVSVKNTNVYVDNQPLLFFHFQGFKQIFPCVYDLGLWDYGIKMSQEFIRYIFIPYIYALRKQPYGKRNLYSMRDAKVQKGLLTKINYLWWRMLANGIYQKKFVFIVHGKFITFFDRVEKTSSSG